MSSSSSPRLSSSSSSSQNSDHELPTIRELNNLVRDSDFQPIILNAFRFKNLTSSQSTHFISLSRTMLRLETDLRNYALEQENLFNSLQNDMRFRHHIRPIHNYYRQTNARRRNHPYRRPYDTNTSTSSLGSVRSRREITILDMEIPPPPSYDSSTSSLPLRRTSLTFTTEVADATLTPLALPTPPSPTTSPPTSESNRSVNDRTIQTGTQQHPIIIEDFEDWRCTRCNQRGHDYEDCDTPILVSPPCPTCIWTRQRTCDHYLITPVWTRQQQQIIAQREWKPRLSRRLERPHRGNPVIASLGILAV